jgi:Valyl-tRNA synthetase
MNGLDSYWQVGTDHAGIGTQMVVENNLANEGKEKNDLGREKFLEEVWKWKDYSEEKITSQIKSLGSTVEWDKYRFNFDDEFCESVNKGFVEL